MRAVERYAAAEKLPARYIRGKTGQILDFEQADLEHFKADLEMPTPKVSSLSATSSVETRQGEQNKSRQEVPEEERQGPTTALAKVVEPQSKAPETNPELQFLVQALQELQRQGGRTLSAPVEAKPLLTLAECSALTGLSRATLKSAVNERKLHARQIGRSWRVRRDELDQWLQTI